MSVKGPFDPDNLPDFLFGSGNHIEPSKLFDALFPVPAPPISLKDLAAAAPLVPPVRLGMTPPPSRENLFSPVTLGPPPVQLGSAPPTLPAPAKPEPPVWGAEFAQNFVRSLLRQRRPDVVQGRVLPKLEDLAIMDGRQLNAALVYTDLDSFTKIVATQPTARSFVLLQAVVELVSRITSHYGGTVVDCAGDRLLSVFHKPAKDASLKPVRQAVTSAFWTQSMLAASSGIFAEHGIVSPQVAIGIDYGSVTAVCVGLRGNKRLVFLGDVANNAAKLQDVAKAGETVLSYPVFLRKPTYMNTWRVTWDSHPGIPGYLIRVNQYFAKTNRPPKAE